MHIIHPSLLGRDQWTDRSCNYHVLFFEVSIGCPHKGTVTDTEGGSVLRQHYLCLMSVLMWNYRELCFNMSHQCRVDVATSRSFVSQTEDCMQTEYVCLCLFVCTRTCAYKWLCSSEVWRLKKQQARGKGWCFMHRNTKGEHPFLFPPLRCTVHFMKTILSDYIYIYIYIYI